MSPIIYFYQSVPRCHLSRFHTYIERVGHAHFTLYSPSRDYNQKIGTLHNANELMVNPDIVEVIPQIPTHKKISNVERQIKVPE